MKIVLFFILVLFLNACSKNKTTPFSGTFETENIRGSWIRCSIFTKMSDPLNMNDLKVSKICDCFIDKLRSTYDQEYINGQVIKKEKTGKFDPEYESQVNQYGEGCRQKFDILLRNNIKGPYGYIQKDVYNGNVSFRDFSLVFLTGQQPILQHSPT